ncbi:hypothetical protein [Kitasatospora sp. GP82]|uniref:hypothetical protein n=1 Tax=Kitasatospora sp. GP82 TaxID=3035089 RepID=UPI002476ED4F|nr:hypothetical protein [Kitasatospora sp. GP82]MDH6123440.1 hypothetical protein [Kitasatospora sp. GP82]
MALIYFTGQDVGLTATVLTDIGQPATGALAVVLTVTDPTGQITTPAAGPQGGGTYAAVVPAVAAPGVWLYRWTATGPGTGWVSEGQFQVRGMGLEQIVDIASVRAHLNIPQTTQTSDDELQGFILAAGELAKDVCGPFVPEQHTQTFDGGTGTVVPDWHPVLSVQSVVEYYGLYGFALTEQPLGSQMNAFSYTVDYQTGEITRRTFGAQAAVFALGSKNIRITYTAGRTTVPWSVRLGSLELIRHLWQMTQQGGRPRFGGAAMDGGETHIPMGFALPDRVLELWAPYRRAPGIA